VAPVKNHMSLFFRLKLHVEFQQPKNPLHMYLEAQESDTIDALQTKVGSI